MKNKPRKLFLILEISNRVYFLKTIENCVLRIILKNCFLKIILKNHFLITVLKDIPKYAMGHAWKLFLKTVFCSLKQ